MRNTIIIILREMRQRVRRPGFWVLSLLVPAVLAALYALPVVVSQRAAEPQRVLVVDETGLFSGSLVSNDAVGFQTMPSLEYAESHRDERDLVLFIPMRQTTIPRDAFLYYHGNVPSPAVQNIIDSRLQALLHDAILEDVYGLDPQTFQSVTGAGIRLHTQEAATGHDSFLGVRRTVGLVLAVLMALALTIFGVGVMRSVQAERQNRVAELLLTSVRPVQLMWGKVGGVALTAMIQLAMWVCLTAAAIAGVQAAAPDLFAQARAQQQAHALATKGSEAMTQYSTPVAIVDDTVQGLAAIDMPLTVSMFVIFFLLGLALYGSLLAALSARLDAEADALQWSLLVGSPLWLAGLLAAAGVGGSAWTILCPLTAPVAVMSQLPFGLPVWQAAASGVLLAAAAALSALLAASVYRRNILR